VGVKRLASPSAQIVQEERELSQKWRQRQPFRGAVGLVLHQHGRQRLSLPIGQGLIDLRTVAALPSAHNLSSLTYQGVV